MTTKVTVDAHAGWPVLIEALEFNALEGETQVAMTWTVQPHQVMDVYVYSGRQLRITELKKDA